MRADAQGRPRARTGDMKRFAFLLAAFMMLVSSSLSAADEVTLSLDRTEATTADSVKMTVGISVSGHSGSPVIQGITDFHISPGGTSTNIEFVNGRMSKRTDYIYYIQPVKPGTYHIGPAEVRIGGRAYRSNTVELLVSKASDAAGQPPEQVFLKAEVSKKRSYVQEPLIYLLKLYRRLEVGNLSLNLPEISDLNFRKLGDPLEYQSNYAGQQYNVLELRYEIVAEHAGKYTIEGASMGMTVYEPRTSRTRSPFSDPFFMFSSGRPAKFTSDAIELEIVPLPTEGRPDDFSSLVGTYEIASSVEPAGIAWGESASLTVTLSGAGNVTCMPDIELPGIKQVKVYADQPVLETRPTARGFEGTKTMKWALVPQAEGTFVIPSVKVNFFDSAQDRYRTISTEPQVLTVSPRLEPAPDTAGDAGLSGKAGPVKSRVEELGRDILPNHTSMKDLSGGLYRTPKGMFFWLWVLLPPLAYAAAALVMRFHKRSHEQLSRIRSRGALKVFVKRCRHKEMNAVELIDALEEYFNSRFVLSLGTLTPDEAGKILKKRGVSQDTCLEMMDALAMLHDAVYTGRGEKRLDLGDDLVRILKKAEKEFG